MTTPTASAASVSKTAPASKAESASASCASERQRHQFWVSGQAPDHPGPRSGVGGPQRPGACPGFLALAARGCSTSTDPHRTFPVLATPSGSERVDGERGSQSPPVSQSSADIRTALSSYASLAGAPGNATAVSTTATAGAPSTNFNPTHTTTPQGGAK